MLRPRSRRPTRWRKAAESGAPPLSSRADAPHGPTAFPAVSASGRRGCLGHADRRIADDALARRARIHRRRLGSARGADRLRRSRRARARGPRRRLGRGARGPGPAEGRAARRQAVPSRPRRPLRSGPAWTSSSLSRLSAERFGLFEATVDSVDAILSLPGEVPQAGAGAGAPMFVATASLPGALRSRTAKRCR